MTRMRLAVAALLAFGLGGMLIAIALAFQQRSTVLSNDGPLPDTAIVFTGQFDRVELALSLYEQGRIARLFISGVNAPSGIRPQRFAAQFQLSAHARAGLEAGHIVLATDAHSTIENALEAACWIEGQPEIAEIVLITGRFHMPRASLALERALNGRVSVVMLSPHLPAEHDRSAWDGHELLKFAATAMLTLLPRHLWTSDLPATCL